MSISKETKASIQSNWISTKYCHHNETKTVLFVNNSHIFW